MLIESIGKYKVLLAQGDFDEGNQPLYRTVDYYDSRPVQINSALLKDCLQIKVEFCGDYHWINVRKDSLE